MSAQANAPALPATSPDRNLPALPPSRGLTARIRSLTNHEDKEFLPAHLEILDTPASPYASVFLWVLTAAVASAILWSCLAQIDIFAVASGRVQFSGRSKVVQPFDAGKVKTIFAENGSKVKAGDVLVELDATEAGADLEAKTNQLESSEAEAIRRSVQINAVNARETTAEVTFPNWITAPIQERERSVLSAELGQFFATRESLLSQLAEKTAQQERFTSSVAARQRLMAVLKERADMRETLVAKSSGTRASVIDAVQQVEQTAADLAYDQGQLTEAQVAARSLERRLEQWTREAIAIQTQKLTDAAVKRDSLKQDVIKASLKLQRTKLTAPVAGTVQQLAITTLGQVVTTGLPLMVLVPSEGPIEIEALVQNKDAGFVTPGQQATVKVDAFPFTRYGTLEGRVVRVSGDAIDDRDAGGSTDSLSVSRGQGISAASGAPRTQNLVYPVTIQLDRRSIASDGIDVPLTPGMTVTVEIQTGKRRVIDYLLAPILETTSRAGHER